MNYKKTGIVICLSLLAVGCQKQDKQEDLQRTDVEMNKSINNEINENSNDKDDLKDDQAKTNIKDTNIDNKDKDSEIFDFPQLDIVFNGTKLKMPMLLDEFGEKIDAEKDEDGDYKVAGSFELDDRRYRYSSMKFKNNGNSADIVHEFKMGQKRMNIDILPFGINTKEDTKEDIKEKIPFENKVIPESGGLFDFYRFVYDDVIVTLSFNEDGKINEINFFPLMGDSVEQFDDYMKKTHGETKEDTELIVDGNEIKNPLHYGLFDDFDKKPLDKDSEEFKDLLEFFIRTDRRQSLDEEELANRNTEYLLDNFEELDYYGTKLIMRKDVPKDAEREELYAKDRYLEIMFPSDLEFSLKNKYIDINNDNWDLDALEEILEDEDMEYIKSTRGVEDILIFNLDNYTQIVYTKDYVSIVKNFTREGWDDLMEEYSKIIKSNLE